MVLLCFNLCVGGQLFGQSYYYFENRLPVTDSITFTYFTFLTVAADGSATARINYADPIAGENRLIELQLVDSILPVANATGCKKYLVAQGEPVLIMGNATVGFLLPRIVFERQSNCSDSFYTPLAIDYQYANREWRTAKMIAQQEKTYEELVKEKDFVSYFFNSGDEFYHYLYDEKTRTPPVQRLEKLYLVVVANTLDPSIGITSQRDYENITLTFTRLAKDLGIPLIATPIIGRAFNKKGVEQVLAKLKPAPIDIVIFYYSGHGFRYANDISKYPRISMRTSSTQQLQQNNLSIEAIHQQVVKKGAKVSIVLSDCCNEDIGAPVPVGRELLRTRRGGVSATTLNMANCNALFFPAQPVSILTSSAEVNQLATGNPVMGGFFTCFFNILLNESLYGFQQSNSWLRLLLAAKEKARWQALSAMCGSNRCVQRAEISVLPPR